jgi:hypothetical protein
MHVLCMYDCVSCMYVCMYVCVHAVLLFKQNCRLAMKLHFGKRVTHFKSWWRSGQVIQWYTEGDPREGKMWVLFDDGEVELRWITAFTEEVKQKWITPIPEVPKTVGQSGSLGCSHVCMYVCMHACMYHDTI